MHEVPEITEILLGLKFGIYILPKYYVLGTQIHTLHNYTT